MFLDVAVVGILMVALFLGYQRGVIQPLMAEIFFFGTLLVIFRFHDQYTSEMQKIFHLNAVLSVFVAIILAIVMGAIGGAVGGAFHRVESIRGVDGLLGIFVHVAVTLVFIYLAISVLVTLDNAFEPTLKSASMTLAQVNRLESWIQSNPITAAMVSKQDLKALQDAAKGASGAKIDNVQGIHQLQQIYTGFLQPQLHGSRTVPIILSIGSHVPLIGHVGPGDLKPLPSPAPSPSPAPTHSPTPHK
ncbi:MAG: CvpA family protein [Candidatus Dormibacteraeota bacterium]|nr:CvpA family protein [Candidatus Dormibacteraeota bacterium]